MPQHKEISLLAVGDVMLGDSPYCFGHGVGSLIESCGPLFPWEHVCDVLKNGDITFGNLEIVISRHDRKVERFSAIEYRGQPAAMEGLVQSGFDIVNAATNHSMEHGIAALEETLELLDKHRISRIGVDLPDKGVTRHSYLTFANVKFCFLGYNFRPQQYFLDPPAWPDPDLDFIKKDIDSLRGDYDYLIASLHWGNEFITYPSPKQVKIAHALIDHGVNVILGHHTHIVQGVEKYNGGIIAYSLGNFVYDMWQLRLRKTMILNCIFNSNGELTFDIIPVIINQQHQPVIQVGDNGENLKNEISALSNKIGQSDDVGYERELEINTKIFRGEVYKYYLSNFWKYNPKHLFANFVGAMNKRL